jgi:hypothetical protein
MQFPKTVYVTNTGETSEYVRVAVEFSDSRTELTSELSNDGVNWYSVQSYKDHLPDGWAYVDDPLLGGPYYYYKKVLKCKKTKPDGTVVQNADSTTTLFKYVRTKFSTNDFANYYNIYCYSEAIQVIDNVGQQQEGNNAYINTWRSFLLNRS